MDSSKSGSLSSPLTEKSPKKSKRPTGPLLIACISAAATQALNVLPLAVVNLPQRQLMEFFNESYVDHYGYAPSESGMNFLWGITVGIPFFIAMMAAMTVRPLAEHLGRKASLFYLQTTINIFAAGLCAISKPMNSFELFIAGRLVFGICLGIAVSLASIYMTECSPPHIRGMSGSFLGLCGTTLFSLTTIICLPQLLGTTDRWPYIFILMIAFCIIAIINAYLILPETPKYLYLKQKNTKAAENIILRLYGPETDVAHVLSRFEEEEKQASTAHISFADLWRTRHLRRGLLIGCCGALGRSLCGVNIIYAFSTNLIETSFGVTPLNAKYISVALMAPQLVACITTTCIIDRVSRRGLFLTTLGVMTCCNTLFVMLYMVYDYGDVRSDWLLYIAIGTLMLSTWVFPLGVTPIGFILVSEVTPQAARSKAVSVAMCCLHTGFLLHYTLFPILNEFVSALAILILAVIPTSIVWLLLYRFMPETRGRPVEEIVKQWTVQEPPDQHSESLLRSENGVIT